MKVDASIPLKAYSDAAQNKPAANGNFGAMLSAYTQQLNHNEKAADAAGLQLASGKNVNTSETLLAIQKAELSFQLMIGVRNKLVDAYHEIMRMQV